MTCMAQKISRREFLKLASGTSLFGLGVLASGCASEQKQSGGEVIGEAAALAEGDAAKRTDILYLAPLPLFAAE